jgi:hypothetical protein
MGKSVDPRKEMPLVGMIGPWTVGDGTCGLPAAATAAVAGAKDGTAAATRLPTKAARTASAVATR